MAASTSRYTIDYAGSFTFPVTPADLWQAIGRMDQFEGWWGWLGQLRVEGAGLAQGSVLKGTVHPPVPYHMQVRVQLDECVPATLIDATVAGDLEGDAHLRLHAEGERTVTDVSWSLEMKQPAMRVAALVAYPLLRWGHDRVVEATVNSFRRQLRAG